MEKNNKLTDELTSLENDFLKSKQDLKSIENKLSISYDYETTLNLRIAKAQKETKEIRLEYFQKVQEIQKLIQEMKEKVNLYTGNFL